MAQTSWGALIAWYLFLAGTGAGIYLIGGFTAAIQQNATVLRKVGVYLGPPLVAVGSILLLLDLGRPERFLYSILRPFSSMISFGFIILSLFIVLGFCELYLIRRGKESRIVGVFRKINYVTAFGTATYTGLLLGVVKAIPFWNNPLLPVLFLISALSCGAGLGMLGLSLVRSWRNESALRTLGQVDLSLIIFEAIALFFLFFMAKQSSTAMAAGAALLLTGALAPVFWIMVVLVGLILPLVLKIVSGELRLQPKALMATSQSHVETAAAGSSSLVPLLTGVCLIVGGLCLRYVILAGGIRVPLGF